MKIYIFLGLFVHSFLYGISLKDIHQKSAYVYYSISKHKGRSHIAFIKDQTGVIYVVKQYLKKDHHTLTLNGQFRAVRELFGALIAQFLNINSHEVCVIPAGKEFVGKKETKGIATLHSFILGFTLNKSKFRFISLKQWNEKKGIGKDKIGLNIDVIRSMKFHEELVMIVALDTLIGNNDRSRNNIFYHNRHFYIIDMDRALADNMAQLAQKQLVRLKKHNILKKSDLEILQKYKNTLCSYILKCPLEKLYELFDYACRECGFVKGGIYEDGLEIAYENKQLLKENYHSIVELIDFLDHLN